MRDLSHTLFALSDTETTISVRDLLDLKDNVFVILTGWWFWNGNEKHSQGTMMVPTLAKPLGKTMRDHTTAVLELTNLLEGTMLILTTRNVCMPELTPVQINREVMPDQRIYGPRSDELKRK
ncbi:hypothetical protein Bca4012_010957 [Brassica carinata]